MTELSKHVEDCAASRAALRLVSDSFAGHLAARWADLFDPTTADKDIFLRVQAGRKRTWPEAFRERLLAGLAKKQKPHAAGTVASVEGACTRRLSDWEGKRMQAFHAMLHRLFGNQVGTFVITSDATRLGNPAEVHWQ